MDDDKNPLGHLYRNLTNLLEDDPEQYQQFMRQCSQELERTKARPEPYACLQVKELNVSDDNDDAAGREKNAN